MPKSRDLAVCLVAVIGILLASSICMAQQEPEGPSDLRIKLATFTFDPLERTPAISDSLLVQEPPEGPAYRIIQFKRALTRKQTEFLKSQFGLKLDHYIPSHAYLEMVSRGMLDSLARLEYFRWGGLYQPAYKISPTIGKRLDAAEFAGQPYEFNVTLFSDADAAAVKIKAEDLGFEVLNLWDDLEVGPKRLKLRAPDLTNIGRLANLPEVLWIEEFGRIKLRSQTVSWILQTNVNNSRTITARGLRGENQIIGHIDGLLDINHCFFQDAADNTPSQAHRKVVAYRSSGGIPSSGFDDHGTLTAAIVAGQDLITAGTSPLNRSGNDGNAFRARLSHADLDDITGSGTNASNLNSTFIAQYQDGARVFTNSWGDDGTTAYTTWCEDIDRFTWEHEDVLVVFAATNTASLKTPENAKNVLAVVASNDTPNQNNIGSGGDGPTSDSRRKPEIVAPGCPNIQGADANTNCGIRGSCGTSFAAPAVAAYGAIVRQYFSEGWYPSGTKQPHNSFVASGALIKAVLLNGTVDMTGTDEDGAALTGYPNAMEGWGRLLLENSLYFANDPQNLSVWDVRRANGLYSGDSHNYSFTVANNGQPLKITLVWTEPAASAGSATPVINDLDLVVIAPDNVTTYSGNDINTATGVSNANGGVNDNLNNVEMVILNTPAVGTYTLIVREGADGIDQGGQGYALVATADTEDPPVPTGDQNTLVVRVGMSDILAGAEPPLTTVQNIMTDVASYFDDIGYGTVTITPEYPPPVTLDNPSTYYYHPSRNVLIEMTEEVIDKLIAANPDVFDKGTTSTADDIDRIVIVLNDQNFTGDWATTGPWPYDLPGGLTRRISVSVQSVFNDPERRFAHGLAHQFGLVDLYAHPNVVFAQPHVDEWDIMAMPPQRCGAMAWSKERATWITTHGSTIEYIPRPAAGATYNNTLGINFISSTNQNRKAIALGMSEGAANIEDEDVFYFVEARTNTAGGPDDVLPEEGALLYYVDEDIPQGSGPVRITDDVVSTLSLSDAALEVGDSQSPAGRGLTVTVQNGTGGADRDIQISYDPPETDNDVNITVGDPAWTSPDIWVDSQKDGFDEDMGRTPMDRGDQPVTGEVNRVYVRVYNAGPGDAYDFTIYVRVSEPYHTVGGEADFDTYVGEIYVPVLSPASSPLVDYVEWTPEEDGNPHTCAWVEIPNVFNDVNPNNNQAQQNLQEVPSTHASPYEIVTYNFGFTNPDDNEGLFYFRAEDVPDGWTAEFNPPKALLSANQRIECTLTITPPDDAPVCTEHRISVTSWTPAGNTLVQVGGGTVQVDLRNRTDMTLTTEIGKCYDPDLTEKTGYMMARGSRDVVYHVGYQQGQQCLSIVSQGCTSPPRPFEEIVIRYEDPSGYPIYRTVTTDEFGCYSDFYAVAEGGTWEVTAYYPGDDCEGPATTALEHVGIPLDQTGDQDGDELPDEDEPQGDHDGDGIIGLFDRDSDNDGIIDGRELPGDCDRDGHQNVVDPDSDNDGIIDGKDPAPCTKGRGPWHRRLLYSFHLGSAHPLGDLDSLADANVHAHVDLTYIFRERVWLVLMAGLSQFTAESSSGIDHPRWGNLSLNAQVIFPVGGGPHYYLRGGPGSYWPKSGSTEMGFNLGAGGFMPLSSSFSLGFGFDLHQIQTKDPTRFLTLHLGVVYR